MSVLQYSVSFLTSLYFTVVIPENMYRDHEFQLLCLRKNKLVFQTPVDAFLGVNLSHVVGQISQDGVL